jgi:aryl-alcohol dehydrogenase-like predicted oxidoreductase
VVLCSKTVAVSGRGARADVERALRQMGVEEIDIFLLQTMRSGLEFRIRRGAWQALQDLKREGRIRAIGVAAHGLGVLQAALHEPALDVVLGRINYAGDLMDRWQEDLPSLLAGLPPVKRLLLDLLPRSLFARLAGRVHHLRASPQEQAMARELFARLAAAGKEVLGMKIFGEGALAGDVPRAVAYAAGLPWLRAILVGACSEAEIDAVVAAASQAQGGR